MFEPGNFFVEELDVTIAYLAYANFIFATRSRTVALVFSRHVGRAFGVLSESSSPKTNENAK
jgi:hypothetical protein